MIQLQCILASAIDFTYGLGYISTIYFCYFIFVICFFAYKMLLRIPFPLTLKCPRLCALAQLIYSPCPYLENIDKIPIHLCFLKSMEHIEALKSKVIFIGKSDIRVSISLYHVHQVISI